LSVLHDPAGVGHAAGCEAEFTRLQLRSDPEQWAALAAAWDAFSGPYQAAYARWRQAEALLARKAPGAAAVLRQAYQTTVKLGEVPLRHELERLAQRARIDLQPPSGKPRNPRSRHVANVQGLTPREQEVLRHLVEGRTNRQIARALFTVRRPPASTSPTSWVSLVPPTDQRQPQSPIVYAYWSRGLRPSAATR
jgi:hypothetical protein